MKRNLMLCFLFCVLSVVKAQQGSPLLSHFSESRDVENQSWAICQDNNGMMLFANRKGLLSFDGQYWDNLRIPVIPYAMRKNPVDGKIYIGGNDDFGYLEHNITGAYNYISLSGDTAETGLITGILLKDTLAWFYSDLIISCYNLKKNKLELKLSTGQNNPYSGMFVTPSNTYINVSGKGLFRIDSDTLFPIVTGYLTSEMDILFALPFNESMVLLGMGNGDLSLFDGIKYYDYQIRDDGYLKQNILSEGITLGDSAYAFSTLDGGALVVEKQSGRILFTINHQNQLPDDEIFALGSDKFGGLWLSHQYGLTRADLFLPVGNYTIFPGLTGNLTDVTIYNRQLYIATSEGIFYLDEVKNFSEVEIFIKEDRAARNTGTSVESPLIAETQSSRRNIFTRIFGRKITDDEPAGDNEIQKPEETKSAPALVRKKISKLESVSYIYRKVEGLNDKCRQMVSTPDGILAATNRGLFLINNHKAQKLVDNHYINTIGRKPVNDQYFVATADGYFSVRFQGGRWGSAIDDPGFRDNVYSVNIDNLSNLWLGGDNTVFRADASLPGSQRVYKKYTLEEDFPERYLVDHINDSIFLFTESGIYYFDYDNDRFDKYLQEGLSSGRKEDITLPLSNSTLYRKEEKWFSPDKQSGILPGELSLLKLFSDIIAVNADNDKIWVISSSNQIFGIDRARTSLVYPGIDIIIKSISSGNGISYALSDIKFERGNNIINFEIVAPGYLRQNTTQYQYFINKVMADWSSWSYENRYKEVITRAGDYILQVRAMDLWGNIGEIQSVKFEIKAPFTKTATFYILTGLICLFVIVFIIRFRERQLNIKNMILEEKVRERTYEIEAKKAEITSSIEYARRIQMALLPMEEHFREVFADHFIFFRPRDIVSGDFYWIGENDDKIFFSVADCTGHGVPGAFMSALGISTLNEIITNYHNLQADTVLNLLREKTKITLHQTGKVGEASDGMDIAFCVLDKEKEVLHYAGAFNPLFLFQDGECKEIRADRMPIGIHYGHEIPFTDHRIEVKKGDTIYIFSDGFIDQFGGTDGTKYKRSSLKNLLSEIYLKPMCEQLVIIEKELIRWSGKYSQVDDITILGIRI